MGVVKKIAKVFITIAKVFIVIFLIIAGIDIYGQFRDQYHIPGTKCYLIYNDMTFTVDLVYKQCPMIYTPEKILLFENIREVYWNDKKEIIAVSYGLDTKFYYFLTPTTLEESSSSPDKPYMIYPFSSKEDLDLFIARNGHIFDQANHYRWRRVLDDRWDDIPPCKKRKNTGLLLDETL